MIESLKPHEDYVATEQDFPGAYVITHKPSGKKYVGSSAKVGHRLAVHKSMLKRQVHHCEPLQQLYNDSDDTYNVIYGTTNREEAFDLEQALIDHYHIQGVLLNKALDARDSARGREKTPEERERVGRMNRGKKFSPEWCRKISESQKGKVMTAEHRKNIGDSRRGKPLTPEGRATLDASNLARRAYVYCDGAIYHGTREAGAALGKDHGLISYRARSKQPRWANWYYCDKDGNPK